MYFKLVRMVELTKMMWIGISINLEY